jgi:hypothetical protein
MSSHILISSTSLSSSQSSISFTSIPQNYKDLVIYAFLRSDRATAVDDQIVLRFNSNSNSSTYYGRILYGNGGNTFSSNDDSTFFQLYGASGAGATSGAFGTSQFYVQRYAGSSTKQFSAESVLLSNSTTQEHNRTQLYGGVFTNTTPVTSIQIAPYFGSNWVSGSIISLYGIG